MHNISLCIMIGHLGPIYKRRGIVKQTTEHCLRHVATLLYNTLLNYMNLATRK